MEIHIIGSGPEADHIKFILTENINSQERCTIKTYAASGMEHSLIEDYITDAIFQNRETTLYQLFIVCTDYRVTWWIGCTIRSP